MDSSDSSDDAGAPPLLRALAIRQVQGSQRPLWVNSAYCRHPMEPIVLASTHGDGSVGHSHSLIRSGQALEPPRIARSGARVDPSIGGRRPKPGITGTYVDGAIHRPARRESGISPAPVAQCRPMVARGKFAASGKTGSERDQSGVSRVRRRRRGTAKS
jgi:hypothetical protein